MAKPRDLDHMSRLPLPMDDGPAVDRKEPWRLNVSTLETFTQILMPGQLPRAPWPFLLTHQFLNEPDATRESFLMFECRDGCRLVLRFVRTVPESRAEGIQAACDDWNANDPSPRAYPCCGLAGAAFRDQAGTSDAISLELVAECAEQPAQISLKILEAMVRDLLEMASGFWNMAHAEFDL